MVYMPMEIVKSCGKGKVNRSNDTCREIPRKPVVKGENDARAAQV
jgi:hypothetical protein